MTPITALFGPALNRDTVGNVQKDGFRLCRVENIYLDVVKAIEGQSNILSQDPHPFSQRSGDCGFEPANPLQAAETGVKWDRPLTVQRW
jgi:hypothetical protein